MSYRAVVVGATGAVGGALVRELIESTACSEVVTMTRRHVQELTQSNKVTAHLIDFANLRAETVARAKGCEVAFCTLGVGQPRKASKEEFWRVDVEWAAAFADGAKAAGARHISLLSSVGAARDSRNPYLRVKGEAEHRVASAWIDRTSLFRPSVLITRNIRYGFQDRATRALFPMLQLVLPRRYHSIRVEHLARAMRVNAEATSSRRGVEVLEYPDFVKLFR
jgi:uncharacterized protein YbjT (DUF2867 family)